MVDLTSSLPKLPSGLSWKLDLVEPTLGLAGPYEAQIVADEEKPVECSNGETYVRGWGSGYGDSYFEAANKIHDYMEKDGLIGPYLKFEKEWDNPSPCQYSSTAGYDW